MGWESMARQNENRSKFEYQSANVIFHSSTCSKTGDIMLQSSHTAPFLLLSKKQILWCSSSKLHLKNVSAKSRHWDRVCGLRVSPEADRKPDLQTSTYFPFFAPFPHTWIKVWHSISGLLNKVVNKYEHTLQSQNQIEKLQVTTSGQIQEEILFMRWFVTYKDSCQTRNNLKLNLLGQFSQEGGVRDEVLSFILLNKWAAEVCDSLSSLFGSFNSCQPCDHKLTS